MNLTNRFGPGSPKNKLAKARKMRKPPGMLGLKKFGPGKIWVENVWIQNTCILAFLHTSILAYMHTCILAYVHMCMRAYVHTCILAYL